MKTPITRSTFLKENPDPVDSAPASVFEDVTNYTIDGKEIDYFPRRLEDVTNG